MPKQPMNSLPRNARFIGLDRREHIVFTPASETGGWVVCDTGTFEPGQAVKTVEVTYEGNQP
jgi:hypothetical protein